MSGLAWAGTVRLQDEGTDQGFPWSLNCVGAGISCTVSSSQGTLTVSGGGAGNSFETIDVPAGTDPVADSSTDTLTITETSFLTITGTAATDTIDITQVTTDLGTDGLIAANAVALTTDTTGNYVAAVTTSVLTGLTGGNVAAEGTTSALAFDYSQPLSGDVNLGANAIVFGVNGLVAEGETANTIELFIAIPDPATTDKTITLFNATDTVVGKATTDTLTNKTIAAADNVVTADDTICTDCLNATEIEDIYVLNAGDTMTGNLTIGNGVSAGTLSFLEGSGGGTNVKAFASPATITADTTCTFEDDANFIPDSCVGDGTDGGGGDDIDVEYTWPASAMEPLEAAESIPPLTKTTGTNIDEFSVSYDATTDEGRKVTFTVPQDVAAGTVSIRLYWWSLTATSGDVVWDARLTATGADSETWDAALTTDSATCTVDGTLREFDVCTVTDTVANYGWAAGDRITIMIYRDANAAGDTMAGDAELSMVELQVPVS